MDSTLAHHVIPQLDRRRENSPCARLLTFAPKRVLILKSDGQRRATLIAATEALFPGADRRVFATARAALAELPIWRPDLAILGVDTIDLDGLDYLPEVVSAGWAGKTVVVVARKDRRVVAMLRGLRVDAIVDSYAPDTDETRLALAAVQSGRRYVSVTLRPLLDAKPLRLDKMTLSPREDLVLSVLGEGLDNQQAAKLLRVTEASVRGYRARIMSKLRIQHRGELTRHAVQQGYTRFVGDVVLHPGSERELEAIRCGAKIFRLD